MRIIGGSLKGRIIKGKIPPDIRPTTDMVRESIFNILSNFISFEGLVIGDFCAGTGLLGFEALSRGAGHCVFVDKSIYALKFIAETGIYFSIEIDKYSVFKKEVIKFLNNVSDYLPSRKFDLIFCDPPYHSFLLNNILEIITSRQIIAVHGLFVAEHDDSEIIICPKGWIKVSGKKFGSTVIDIYQLN